MAAIQLKALLQSIEGQPGQYRLSIRVQVGKGKIFCLEETRHEEVFRSLWEMIWQRMGAALQQYGTEVFERPDDDLDNKDLSAGRAYDPTGMEMEAPSDPLS